MLLQQCSHCTRPFQTAQRRWGSKTFCRRDKLDDRLGMRLGLRRRRRQDSRDFSRFYLIAVVTLSAFDSIPITVR